MKVKSLLVDLQGYLFLQEKARKERGGEVTEKFKNHLEDNFNRLSFNLGRREVVEILDRNLGGASNGKWTSWSVEEMAKMLAEQGMFCAETKAVAIPLNI